MFPRLVAVVLVVLISVAPSQGTLCIRREGARLLPPELSLFGGEVVHPYGTPVGGSLRVRLHDESGSFVAPLESLERCGGGSLALADVAAAQPNNFGIGLVGAGNAQEYNFAQGLGGDGGWILLIFAGVDKTTTAPQSGWVEALQACYAKNLKVVVRIGPPWGQSHYRSESDDAEHLVYTTLANAFAKVVTGLPLPPNGAPLYLQIDNEPDLCYEWFCATKGPSPLSYQTIASEYAHFYDYVADALRNTSVAARLRLSHGALSPGSARQCGCCGSQNCPGDQAGVTGLAFMQAMTDAVPDVFQKIDFLASHSYGAQGVGWGFNVPYEQALPGLTYYQLELKQIQRESLHVLITETGWATHRKGLPSCTEQQKAQWTVQAYNGVWRNDTRVQGVMPFMLMDPVWGTQDGYEYVNMNGSPAPVYGAVKTLRCKAGFGPC